MHHMTLFALIVGYYYRGQHDRNTQVENTQHFGWVFATWVFTTLGIVEVGYSVLLPLGTAHFWNQRSPMTSFLYILQRAWRVIIEIVNVLYFVNSLSTRAWKLSAAMNVRPASKYFKVTVLRLPSLSSLSPMKHTRVSNFCSGQSNCLNR